MSKQQKNEEAQKPPTTRAKANKEVKQNKTTTPAMPRIGKDAPPITMLNKLPIGYRQTAISMWGNQLAQRKIVDHRNNERKRREDSTIVQAKSNENEVKIAPESPDTTGDGRFKREITAESDATRMNTGWSPPSSQKPGSETSPTPVNNEMSGKWDFDSIPFGDKNSPKDFLEEISNNLDILALGLPPLAPENHKVWVERINLWYEVKNQLAEVAAFCSCAPTNQIKFWDTTIQNVTGRWYKIQNQQDSIFSQQKTADWEKLLKDPELSKIAFNLKKRREFRKFEISKLAPEVSEKKFIFDQALNNRAKNITNIEIGFSEGNSISLTGIYSKFRSDPNSENRKQTFYAYKLFWNFLAESCAEALKSRFEYQLALDSHLGQRSALQEYLINNNIKKKTADVMWAAVAATNGKLLKYFQLKAELLGKDKLSWYDLFVAVGKTNEAFTFKNAGKFTVDNIRSVNPQIANYCDMALKSNWVDAESTGQSIGSTTSYFPISGQARVSLLFNSSHETVIDLAHELGHVYQCLIMSDRKAPVPYGAQDVPQNLLETSAVLNETIVLDAASKGDSSKQEQLMWLAARLDRHALYSMQSYAQYLFEKALFEQQQLTKKSFSAEELTKKMSSLQQTAFQGGLDEGFPLEWAETGNFYNLDEPFQNLSYTFAYLFSNLLHAKAMKQKETFVETYYSLLRDAGSMSVEDLASTHLGVDLTDINVWIGAANYALDIIPEMEKLMAELGPGNRGEKPSK